jgi:hypothetical protein
VGNGLSPWLRNVKKTRRRRDKNKDKDIGKEKGGDMSGPGRELDLYDHYHTSYCAAIGLLRYRFQALDSYPPLPSFIRYLEEELSPGTPEPPQSPEPPQELVQTFSAAL